MWKVVKKALLALGLSAAVLGAYAQTCGLRDNWDGTKTDPVTGLQIQKCEFGQTWSSGRCIGDYKVMDWKDAVRQFGQSEWRLITKNEAEQVSVRSSGCLSQTTLTSTADGSENAWMFDFQRGRLMSMRQGKDGFRLVRSNQGTGTTSASSSNQPSNSAQNTQQATAQQQPAQNRQPSRDRPDLMGHGCDVGQGTIVKNGCAQTIHYVMCIVRHPDGRTTGANTCQGGQFLSGSLSSQESRRVVSGEGSTDYLVAACKNPARPYNFSYSPNKGISTFCGE